MPQRSPRYRKANIPSKVHGGYYRVFVESTNPVRPGTLHATVIEGPEGGLTFHWREEGSTFILFRSSMTPEQAKLALVKPKPERSHRSDPNVGKLIDIVGREQALRSKELDLRAKELEIKEQLNQLEAARLQLEYMQRKGGGNAPRLR